MQTQSRTPETAADPFWRGVALYRDEQWLEAAAAFAASENPLAHYNLANSYAQLGRFALALETYGQIDKTSPVYDDAQFNAALMQELLATADDSAARSQPSDQAPSPQESGSEKPAAKPQAGDETNDAAAQEQSHSATQAQAQAAAPGSQDSKGNSDTPGDKKAEDGAQQGRSERDSEQPPSPATAADGDGEHEDGDPLQGAAEGRTMTAEELEAQLTQQWLTAIKDEPARFLRARIAQAVRERRAAGTLAEPADSAW
ncbi:hypothetical protein Q4485_03345 [Granulosicoccaceae sp. 1_MG-2023]|nr:hypothetical protein [Granulosicoccaceae sp. 1_MG-2023]